MNNSNTANEKKYNKIISKNEVILYLKNIIESNTQIINFSNISNEEHIQYIKK